MLDLSTGTIISGLIMSFSTAAVGACFYLKTVDKAEGLEWIPLVGLVVFMIGYSVGKFIAATLIKTLIYSIYFI